MQRMRVLLLSLPLAALAAAPAAAQERPARGDFVVMQSGASMAAKRHLAMGQHEADMGRTREAQMHYAEALRAEPSWGYAHLLAANIAPSALQYREHLSLAVANMATATEAERLLIQAAKQGLDNDPVGRLATLARLTEVAPADPRAWILYAGQLAGRRRDADSRAAYRKAVEVAPSFAPAHAALAGNLMNGIPRDLEAAERQARQLITLAPGEALSYDVLGDVLRAQGKLAEARDAYTEQAKLEKNDGSGYQQRALANMYLGNLRQARMDLDSAWARTDSLGRPGLLGARANTYLMAGDFNSAISTLERSIAYSDSMGFPDAQVGASRAIIIIALHAGNPGAARRELDRYRSLQERQVRDLGSTPASVLGSTADLLYIEGQIAARSGDYAGARAKAAEMMRVLEPGANPRRYEGAHELMGMADLFEGRYTSALAHFDQASSTGIYVMYHRAVALEGAGRAADARPHFERVANENFANVPALLVRADARRKLRTM
jgi:tetratricopeptide (TPR) repeat protein